MEIYTHTHVDKISGGKSFAEIFTSEGYRVCGDYVFVATNVPINDRITLYTKLQPMRTYAIGATVKKGSVPLALYWDTEDPYH